MDTAALQEELYRAQEALHIFADNQGCTSAARARAKRRFVELSKKLDPTADEVGLRQVADMLADRESHNSIRGSSLEAAQEGLRQYNPSADLADKNPRLQAGLDGSTEGGENYSETLALDAVTDRVNDYLACQYLEQASFVAYRADNGETVLGPLTEPAATYTEFAEWALARTLLRGFGAVHSRQKLGTEKALRSDRATGEPKLFDVPRWSEPVTLVSLLSEMYPDVNLPTPAEIKEAEILLNERLKASQFLGWLYAEIPCFKFLVSLLATTYCDIVRCARAGAGLQAQTALPLGLEAGKPSRTTKIETLSHRITNVSKVVPNYQHIAGGFGKRYQDVSQLLRHSGKIESRRGPKKGRKDRVKSAA
jgi:hypothetical protein